MRKNKWLKRGMACVIFGSLIFSAGHSFTASHAMTISILAGKGVLGTTDGDKEQAQFQLPSFAIVDHEGTIYVSDTGNHLIRKVTTDGIVTTIAGQTGIKDDYGRFIGGYEDGEAMDARFHDPKGLAISSKGILYIADAGNGVIRTLDPSTNQVTTFATDLKHPTDLVIDEFDNLYVSETLAHRIVKITPNGTHRVLAGGGYEEIEGWLAGGLKDGIAENAQFNEPSGLALSQDGTLYIADTGNQRIRTLTPDGRVSTLAGSGTAQMELTSYVQVGDEDGLAQQAQFNFPNGLALADDGTLYVADTLNHRIRQISSDGQVSTVAGSARPGHSDGSSFNATFDHPSDLFFLPTGELGIVDEWNHNLRLLTWEERVFNDLKHHWGASYILALTEKKIINGYPDGTFRPDQSVTRAEFTKMLILIIDQDIEGNLLSFDDRMDIPEWVKDEVSLAVQLGIIEGYSDHTFQPNKFITRAEMSTMVARALQLELRDGPTSFADDQDIPTWAKGAVEAIKGHGITEGQGENTFNPNVTATRAEAVTMIVRMMESNDKIKRNVATHQKNVEF